MDYVHVNGHDKTNIVILAKRCIRFPDVGSFVVRNMSQHCQIFYNFNYIYELYILCICWIIKCLKLHTLLTSVLDEVNGQLHAPTTLLHDSTLCSERKGSQLDPEPVSILWRREKYLPSAWITSRFRGRPTRMLVTILTELFQPLKFHMDIKNMTHIPCRPILTSYLDYETV